MVGRHPEGELIAYLDGTLRVPEREGIERHLERCSACRQTLQSHRALVGDLGRAAPAPPPLDWGRYGADLRAKLAERGAGRRWGWARPLQIAFSAGLAGLLLVLALQSTTRRGEVNGSLAAFEQTALGERLDLVQKFSVLERLDLLEDLDVIAQLDRLAPGHRG